MTSNKKIQEVELEIVNTKNQVEAIIINVIERGEKLENLEEKALVLTESASMFSKQSKLIRRKMWCLKFRNNLIIGTSVLCFIIFIMALLYYELK